MSLVQLCGILLLSRIAIDITRGELILGMVVMAAGLGLGMMPIMTGGPSTLPGSPTAAARSTRSPSG